MSKNDWTDILRDRLDDYQESPSRDLWAGIEQSLAQKGILQDDKQGNAKLVPEKQKKAAFVSSFRRWSIAASLGLLAVGGGYVYFHSRTDSPTLSVRSNPATSLSHDAAIGGKATLPSQANTVGDVLLACSEKLSPSRSEEVSAIRQIEEHSVFQEEETTVESEEKIVGKAEDEVVSASKTVETPVVGSALGLGTSTAAGTYNLHNRQKLGCSVMLFAENVAGGSGGGNMGTSGVMVMSDPMEYMCNKEAYLLPASPLKSTAMYSEAKHHAPLAVGLQVGVGISPRVSLNTGVVYMRVASDFKTFGSSDYDARQVLHYIGVPVSVNYKVWSVGGFHAYATAGAEADFNVKNDTEQNGEKVENVKKDRVQFAGKVSLGMQYDITPLVGLYVEPGARYNFDNGSEIENTFKEKKWNFNFQFGLRVNLE